MSAKLGILAGGGALPRHVAAHCQKVGRPFFIIAFEGETDPETVQGVDHVWLRLGAAGQIIDHLKRANIRELVMAGGIKRPSLSSLRPDWRAARLFARIGLRALGDDGLLRAVIRELEDEGFTLIPLNAVLPRSFAPEGQFGSHPIDVQARADIDHGLMILSRISALDIGQAVVIQQGLVLGVEAIEGTDQLIDRSADLRRPGPAPILVKTRKIAQDQRADLPTIGPRTIERAARAGLRGIAIECGGTLILDYDTVVARADHYGLFLIGCTLRPETETEA